MLKKWLLVLSLMLCGWSAEAAATTPAGIAAEVARGRDGWTVEYRFDRDAGAWLFLHSTVHFTTGKPWRADSWTVETPGVHIARAGAWDALVSDKGPVPRRVR